MYTHDKNVKSNVFLPNGWHTFTIEFSGCFLRVCNIINIINILRISNVCVDLLLRTYMDYSIIVNIRSLIWFRFIELIVVF